MGGNIFPSIVMLTNWLISSSSEESDGVVLAAALVADIDVDNTVREADCCGLRPSKSRSAEEADKYIARAASDKVTCFRYMIRFWLRLDRSRI